MSPHLSISFAGEPAKYALTVMTSPCFGEVHFRVDGIDYYTRTGRNRGGRDVKGLGFGSFTLAFYEEGDHSVEIVDTVIAGRTIHTVYGPVKTGPDGSHVFTQWTGTITSKSKQVTIPINDRSVRNYGNPVLIANFAQEELAEFG